MASTRFRMIDVVLFVVALSALEAIQWDGGPADKANIAVCVGGSATIPWSFVKGDGETLIGLSWMFEAPGKEKTQIATFYDGHFYATDKFKERFVFLPNAGLSLRDAKLQDSGNYSVKVQLLQENSHASFERTVTLSIGVTPPATQDGNLHVTLSDVVRDDVTEDWTVRLYCGHFVDLGQPPVGVVWTTTSGEVRNSSYEDNGTFVLSVSTSDQGGNYSCHLPPSAPAVRCLTATSSLNAAAQLYVDDKDVRLTLLEAQHQETKAMLQEAKTELQETKTELQETKTELQETKKRETSILAGFSSCADWSVRNPKSGVRPIQVSDQILDVYCDLVTDNGGWTVFQRRKDDSVDFYRGWTDYRNGFGDLEGNFWLGLDKLHNLTTSQKFELRVDLHKWDGTTGYATYSNFYVDDASHNFTLHYDNFTGGNVGDGLFYHRGRQFSTKESDHDTYSENCAQEYHGAWWYKDCYYSNLNGNYYKTGNVFPKLDGIVWFRFGYNWYYSMKLSEMKIRPM